MLQILSSVMTCVIGSVLGQSLSLFASVVCYCCPIKLVFSLPLGVILLYVGDEAQACLVMLLLFAYFMAYDISHLQVMWGPGDTAQSVKYLLYQCKDLS